jgi:catechol 2,3-dioxygenase-like lactoylglutathione lyase family enzyme
MKPSGQRDQRQRCSDAPELQTVRPGPAFGRRRPPPRHRRPTRNARNSQLRLRDHAFPAAISVTDVGRSSRFYQQLLGCESGHGGDEYERLIRDGALVLQLHAFDVEHHHGNIGDPSARPDGNGVALWFEMDDFDAAVGRAQALQAEIVLPQHRNPPDGPGGPAHRELWLRDPDGYLVVLASPDGESPWPDPRVG